MAKNKVNTIFNLNNIILSAIGLEDPLSSEIISENEKILSFADKPLKKQYKNILKGNKFELPQKEEPSLIHALVYMTNEKYPQAFWEFAQLLKINKGNLETIKSLSIALIKMKAYSVVIKHFLPVLKKHQEDIEVLKIIGGTYFGIPEYYKKAIDVYEKMSKLTSELPAEHYYRLAFLCERVYQDKKIDKQIMYATKALETTSNKNSVLILLAKMYYRSGQKDKCVEYLTQMMNNNPTPDEKVYYSRFLMKEGRITEAYDIYRCRFETGNVTYPVKLLPEKRWNGKDDLSESTVIVHYEQGFGDTVMFARYIPEIAKKAKKVIFVLQKNLIPLFKSSGYEKYCEILSHEADVNLNIKLKDSNRSVMYSSGSGMAKIPHDYHIPLMDTPFLIGENPDRMSEAGGYLSADPQKIIEFRKKYIKNNKKIKVGLAYHGTKESILTYRDISVKKFLPILQMKGFEFYSFQSDQYAEQLKELDENIKIYDLGKVFKNFEDTACAMNCMDVMISTDNVIMNLAGALGIKTYALFNVITESRWYKTTGDDIGWYKSVKPFKAETFNDWDNLILKVKSQLEQDFVK